jgi:hypothetical protein
MRDGFSTEIKPQLNESLRQLQTSIDATNPTGRINNLRSAIVTATTSGQVTLDRIAGWLKLAQTESKEPFLLDEVISISETSIKASNPEFTIERHIDTDLDDFYIQASLPSFVDMIFQLFDNIVRRSGQPGPPKGKVIALLEEKMIRIRVENDIGDSASTTSKKQRVDQIKEDVRKQMFSKSVRKEEGTGFLKVNKILNHDFKFLEKKVKPSLDFGFEGDSKFYVEITIPYHSTVIKEVEL